MAEVSIREVVKVFEGNVQAVKGIDLEIADKEFVVLVGPSGCGKSTTLRMVAGLEEISSGEIWIGGDLVNDVPPRDRDIAMVCQRWRKNVSAGRSKTTSRTMAARRPVRGTWLRVGHSSGGVSGDLAPRSAR